eukprot:6211406-Pleurochrysis_carterae.AAC.1
MIQPCAVRRACAGEGAGRTCAVAPDWRRSPLCPPCALRDPKTRGAEAAQAIRKYACGASTKWETVHADQKEQRAAAVSNKVPRAERFKLSCGTTTKVLRGTSSQDTDTGISHVRFKITGRTQKLKKAGIGKPGCWEIVPRRRHNGDIYFSAILVFLIGHPGDPTRLLGRPVAWCRLAVRLSL